MYIPTNRFFFSLNHKIYNFGPKSVVSAYHNPGTHDWTGRGRGLAPFGHTKRRCGDKNKRHGRAISRLPIPLHVIHNHKLNFPSIIIRSKWGIPRFRPQTRTAEYEPHKWRTLEISWKPQKMSETPKFGIYPLPPKLSVIVTNGISHAGRGSFQTNMTRKHGNFVVCGKLGSCWFARSPGKASGRYCPGGNLASCFLFWRK